MTVRLLTANLQFTRTPEKHRLYVKHLTETHWTNRPASRTGLVLGTQETKNFRLLGALRWVGRLVGKIRIPIPLVFQGKGTAKSGTALAAFGVTLKHLGIWFGAKSSATLPRWATRGGLPLVGGRCEVQVVHLTPPRSGPTAQKRYLRKVRKRTRKAEKRGHAWAVLGDFNTDLFKVADYLGGVAYGLKGGIGIVCSKNLKVSGNGRDDYGVEHHLTDHPAWWVDVEGIQKVKA